LAYFCNKDKLQWNTNQYVIEDAALDDLPSWTHDHKCDMQWNTWFEVVHFQHQHQNEQLSMTYHQLQIQQHCNHQQSVNHSLINLNKGGIVRWRPFLCTARVSTSKTTEKLWTDFSMSSGYGTSTNWLGFGPIHHTEKQILDPRHSARFIWLWVTKFWATNLGDWKVFWGQLHPIFLQTPTYAHTIWYRYQIWHNNWSLGVNGLCSLMHPGSLCWGLVCHCWRYVLSWVRLLINCWPLAVLHLHTTFTSIISIT